jgi:hypothetical protein
LVACLFIINENGRIGRELRHRDSPKERDSPLARGAFAFYRAMQV